jgi:hypothetical protein
LLLEYLVSTTSLESLVRGYLLNRRYEDNSQATLNIYQTILKNFMWHRSAKLHNSHWQNAHWQYPSRCRACLPGPERQLTDRQSCGRMRGVR